MIIDLELDKASFGATLKFSTELGGETAEEVVPMISTPKIGIQKSPRYGLNECFLPTNIISV